MPGPLHGLKVLDFSSLLPGPYATLMLADLGAEVLQVCAPSRPDLTSLMPPLVPECGVSAATAYLMRNKRSIKLDLKHPAAATVIRRLLKDHDILLEQFRPGVMARLGLDYDSLSACNSGLIYCSLTGYGQTGPRRARAGHDINFIAFSGVASYSGRRGEGPSPVGTQIADLCAGAGHAVASILAAVIHRHRTGEGQWLDVAMSDGMLALNALYGAAFLVDGKEPEPENTLLNGGGLYDYYETRDGRYLSCGALEPRFFGEFCAAIGRPELAANYVTPEAMSSVKEEIREVIRGEPLDHWIAKFESHDACCEPVLTLGEALEDPHTSAREMVVEVSVSSGATVRQIGCPLKFSVTPPEYRHGGVLAGADTVAVLRGEGYTDAEIDEFAAGGLFGEGET